MPNNDDATYREDSDFEAVQPRDCRIGRYQQCPAAARVLIRSYGLDQQLLMIAKKAVLRLCNFIVPNDDDATIGRTSASRQCYRIVE